MNVLEVRGLCKNYPGFQLRDVSFSLPEGQITGFIGRNGAGKTTTLRALLRFVHPDSGEIRFFGEPAGQSELSVRQKISFVSGGIDYYPKKKLRTITAVTKSFYQHWDDEAYRKYLSLFCLDESKTPSQLSAGMKVKYALALALSHNAKLLLLDEPTSGLDPVSRDELLDIFMELCREGITILFSTHITSDLDKCADRIVYIRDGQILTESKLDEFVSLYRTVSLSDGQLTDAIKPFLIGTKPEKHGYSALIRKEDAAKAGIPGADADLESIIIHIEKEGRA